MAQDETRPSSLQRAPWKRLSDWLAGMSPAQAATGFLTIGGLIVIVGLLIRQGVIQNVPSGIVFVIDELYSNAGVELLSIGLTVLVIDSLNRRRAEKERKEELILQLGSPDNGFALEAVRQLRYKGWLEDGSLQGAKLQGANLRWAKLNGTNLREASLYLANLQHARLQGVNLQQADLNSTYLQKAKLPGANLQQADLCRARLQAAYLYQANLQGANLIMAKLQGADLRGTKFDNTTTLPDGTKWTSDRDLREFSDPEAWKTEQDAKASGDIGDSQTRDA